MDRYKGWLVDCAMAHGCLYIGALNLDGSDRVCKWTVEHVFWHTPGSEMKAVGQIFPVTDSDLL